MKRTIYSGSVRIDKALRAVKALQPCQNAFKQKVELKYSSLKKYRDFPKFERHTKSYEASTPSKTILKTRLHCEECRTRKNKN